MRIRSSIRVVGLEGLMPVKPLRDDPFFQELEEFLGRHDGESTSR